MLLEHRRQIEHAIQSRMQKVRTDGASQVVDNSEGAGVDVQQDITLALVHTQAGLIRRIDQALAHIDAGTYGFCVECGGSITATRLRALPFAIRCTTCEE